MSVERKDIVKRENVRVKLLCAMYSELESTKKGGKIKSVEKSAEQGINRK